MFSDLLPDGKGISPSSCGRRNPIEQSWRVCFPASARVTACVFSEVDEHLRVQQESQFRARRGSSSERVSERVDEVSG